MTRRIRNFCIIAHIDHGKSTLADRFLELTRTVEHRRMREQLLDDMDLERERGITIKAKAVSMRWSSTPRGPVYAMNLIDTPGHVDFSYEVEKSLQACEGALLLVDSVKGVEAQTVANATLAQKAGLTIVPVINKIDLSMARPAEVAQEMEAALGIRENDILLVSAKDGSGALDCLAAIAERVPSPQGDSHAPLRALIFDSVYDDYRGVIAYVRVFDGEIRSGDRITMLGTGSTYEVNEVGCFRPQMQVLPSLRTGQVGYIVSNIRRLSDVRVGDTITPEDIKGIAPLPGYREPKPMVFCGLYPANSVAFSSLRKRLEKLSLNDASFTFEPESSDALGFGFRCGFLGLLHMDIVQERIEREGNLQVVQTAPTVTYEVLTDTGRLLQIHSPGDLPDPAHIRELREPIARLQVLAPSDSIGSLMKLVIERRGAHKRTEYLGATRVQLLFEVPLSEILFDFYDKLKSLTRGYGTMDYEILGFRPENLVRLRILVAGTEVDALSRIVHRTLADRAGRRVLQILRKEIGRHQFEIALQASIGSRIVARETIAPLRKNVTAKCYGGDITRKRKLLEKQREGKRRMKQVGSVQIPQKAFLSILRVREDDA